MSEEYWNNLRCRYCNSKGMIYPVRSEIISTERGFGNVTRTQIVQTSGEQANPVQEIIFGQGSMYSRQHVVYTQERVPVIRTRYRMVYQCSKCSAFVGDRQFYRETEDFSIGKELAQGARREFVAKKIDCKYCTTSNDDSHKFCTHCGAPL